MIHTGTLELLADEVHLWILPVPSLDLEVCARLLTSEELARATRFRKHRDSASFIASHGAVRSLLARYTQRQPSAIQIAFGPQGKPRLEPPQDVEFNMTHSGDWIALAFSHGCPVGVDLEFMRPFEQLEETADRFFCADEAREIASLEGKEQQCAFFRCWTRKEAILKATGEGLSARLNDFRVTVLPHEHARVLHAAGDRAHDKWVLHDLALEAGYAGALAYCGDPRRIRQFSIAEFPQGS